jgi:hypothetical protein
MLAEGDSRNPLASDVLQSAGSVLVVSVLLDWRRCIPDPDVSDSLKSDRHIRRGSNLKDYDVFAITLELPEAEWMPLRRDAAFEPELERQLSNSLGGRNHRGADNLPAVAYSPHEEPVRRHRGVRRSRVPIRTCRRALGQTKAS